MAAVMLSGCTGRQSTPSQDSGAVTTTLTHEGSKTTPANDSEKAVSAKTTTVLGTTTTNYDPLLLGWVKAPGQDCQCEKWVCQSQQTTATSVTKTTCIIIPDPDYEPSTRFYKLVIRGDRFRPDNINAMVGDFVIVNITNEQGLHKIRDTYSNRTLLLQPNDNYELTFPAADEGVYLLTCNPFCEEPMEATITINRPYKEVC
ncbi:MAG: hypothetical protein PHG85_01670 [Candidatus Altiarchaeota archaeon]|nr:hypothetical protein [Candidatus Altiarchaeota archaeon]